MKRLISGIQPTGEIHIGNYLGAIKNWVELQEQYESFVFVADYHALTVKQDPQTFPEKVIDAAINVIACGINPDKSPLFIQSHILEHANLGWVFDTITPIGELNRMTQYKDKSKQHSENINVGLFAYPILMAADILIYNADVVPVGEDQFQHIELTRTIARKFNSAYKSDFFKEPEALATAGARIMSLTDPSKKMSKSDGVNSYIALTDSEEVIWQKIAKAVTDPNRQRKTDKGDPKKCNLFSLHQLLSSPEEIKFVDKGCCSAGIGCLECKKILADNINKEIAPIREKISYWQKPENKKKIIEILKQGADRVRPIAQKNLKKIKQIVGLIEM
ncbi:MAG: tryptophan--tRNA ligase [Patescibacteria group bacterium]